MSDQVVKKDFSAIQGMNVEMFYVILYFIAHPEKVGVANEFYNSILPMLKEYQADLASNFPEILENPAKAGLFNEDGTLTAKGEAQAMRCLGAPLRPKTANNGAINFDKLVEGKNFGYLSAIVRSAVTQMKKHYENGFRPNENYSRMCEELSNDLSSMIMESQTESAVI